MKKYLFSLIAALCCFVLHTFAQQEFVGATMNRDGTGSLLTKDASGEHIISVSSQADLKSKMSALATPTKVSSAPVKTEVKKTVFISHRAVIDKDGKQAVILTEASGKETTIAAVPGQTMQETYLAYLEKNGLGCACSPPADPVATNESNTKTAVRN